MLNLEVRPLLLDGREGLLVLGLTKFQVLKRQFRVAGFDILLGLQQRVPGRIALRERREHLVFHLLR